MEQLAGKESRDSTGANLSRANLIEATLVGADLSGADLGDADLSDAELSGVDLSGADLTRANLFRAVLIGANLFKATLIEANLSESSAGWTAFTNLDLRTTKNLDGVRHGGPSSVGIDTIYKSGGEIPEAFLRGAGVPETFIANIKALMAALSPIQFYSCFISYSTKDQDFADRLHGDLQAKGVRCWFAPEDLKIGDKFRSRIDESIRVFDKLLLVLSENSIASPWVEDEVEAALERERWENRLVLFPIRLDDAIMQTDVAWAAHLRHKRHIGDFRAWRDYDSHQEAFKRLLRDLKADASLKR